MSDRSTEGTGATHNTVSGNAWIAGPLVQAERIGSISFGAPGPTAPPRQVPPPSGVFVNRTKELTALRVETAARGAERNAGIVLVTGLGGVGKTQLVSQWVHSDLEQLYPAGQLYVDLDDVRLDGAVDSGAVLAGFLRGLGVHKDYVPESRVECEKLFRSVAAQRGPLLVVVDNAHQAPEVRPLLPPAGLMVVTSHRHLPSLTLDGALHVVVDPLDRSAGIELVRHWQVTAAEGTAAELVRLCGGLPLALRAAGEWLAGRPHLGLDAVVRRLAAGQHRSPTEETDHVDTVLDTVIAELPDHSRRLYLLLGCLPGSGVTAAVAGAAGVTRVDDALGDLVTAHLVVAAESADRPQRFRPHDVVRAHARTLASGMPEQDRLAALRGVADFYLAAAAHADAAVLGRRFRIQEPPSRTVDELSPGEPLFTTSAEALEWLDAERSALLELLRLASKEGWYDAVWRLCESLWALYHSRKHHADSIEAHRLGIEAAQWEGRQDAEVRMRNQLARAHYELRQYGPAQAQLTVASELLGLVSAHQLSGVVRETQGLIALDLGRPDDAEALFRQARSANAEAKDEHGVIVQGYNIGQALVAGGRWQEALEALDEAMAGALAADDGAMLPRIGIVRARALRGLGSLAEAVDSAVSAAEVAAERRQYAKLGQALAVLEELAAQTMDVKLREVCDLRLRELRGISGVAPRTESG